MGSPEKHLTSNPTPAEAGNLLDVNEKLHALAPRLKNRRPEDVFKALRLVQSYSGIVNETLRDMTLVEFKGNQIHKFEYLALKKLIDEINIQYAKQRSTDNTFTKEDLDIESLNSNFLTTIHDSSIVGLELSGILEIPVSVNELVNLRTLNLDGNQLEEIENVDNLTNLTWLDLEGNKLTDIGGLLVLKNLVWLDVRSNQITDFEQLLALTKLEELRISSNPYDWNAHKEFFKKMGERGLNIVL